MSKKNVDLETKPLNEPDASAVEVSGNKGKDKPVTVDELFPDSPGIARALKKSGVKTLAELKNKTLDEISAMPGIQFTRLQKVQEVLKRG